MLSGPRRIPGERGRASPASPQPEVNPKSGKKAEGFGGADA